MRNIKFRCWDTGINFMYYDTDSYNIYNENDNGLHSGYEDKYGTWHQNILMQFTGLFDKNGREIYEGDILKWELHLMYGRNSVCFHDACFRLENYFTEDNALNKRFCARNCEVIGNIYEHPELLEQK